MVGWRVSKARYTSPPSSAFDGEGARRRGGRWSPPGMRVAYASESLALAAMEYFVNLDPTDGPSDLVSIKVEIPDEAVEHFDRSMLPANWRSYPSPRDLQRFGETWVKSATSVCLVVPSAVLPEENNLLINPAHLDFHLLHFSEPLEFRFDPRMWK